MAAREEKPGLDVFLKSVREESCATNTEEELAAYDIFFKTIGDELKTEDLKRTTKHNR